jgi:hypothetical protein
MLSCIAAIHDSNALHICLVSVLQRDGGVLKRVVVLQSGVLFVRLVVWFAVVWFAGSFFSFFLFS